jgi:hypothetical protein
MSLIAGLLIFAVFGAWLSARHRAAVPAAVFSVVATVLVISTPLGNWVPGALTTVVEHVSSTGGQVASVGGAQ